MSEHPSDEAFKKWATGRHAHSLDAYPCECFRAGWDDASAGMVPEGDCIQPVYMMDEDGKEHEAPCECCERRGKPSGQLEAELAKAWEAGRTAAADLVCLQICGCVDRIRALQPPGGKAK